MLASNSVQPNGALPRRLALFYKRLLAPGGAERQLVEEYRYWRDRSVPVKVLTFEARADALFGATIPELEVLAAPTQAAGVFSLVKTIQEWKPDLISVHSGHIDVYLATRWTRVPYIYHHNSPILLHSGREPRAPYSFQHRRAFEVIRDALASHEAYVKREKKFGAVGRIKLEAYALLNRLAMRGAQQIITLSNRTAWEVEQMYGRPGINVRGCLDPQIFFHAPRLDIKRELGIAGREMILSVSRLSHEKRLALLLDAFALLLASRPRAVLVIGGRGPQEAELHRRAAAMGIPDKIRFVGFVPENELWDYYAACDVFATPAYADFDIAPYEALALGRKVVWSTEMETEPALLQSGFVFEARPTVEDFARGLESALAAEISGRPDIVHYSWPRKFARLYHPATTTPGGASVG